MLCLNSFGKLGALVRSAFATGPDAVIKALFANSEVGAWYDPSDLTTMFQDRAGTTPVTADGQPVGLILDKSKGLVLGPELVTNGTFDSDISGWDSYSGFDPTLMEWSAGRLHVITGATRALFGESDASASAITIGKWYKAELDLTVVSGNSPTIGFNVSYYAGQAFAILGTQTSGTYHVTGIFNSALGGNCHVAFDSQATGACEIYIDNFTIKEIAGNHATAPNDSSRPLYKTDGTYHWLQFDGVDDSLSTANADFTATDKMSVFTGNRNAQDTVFNVIVGNGNINSVAGSFQISTPLTGSDVWSGMNGSQITARTFQSLTVLNTKVVLQTTLDLRGTYYPATMRLNGVVKSGIEAGNPDAGTGNYGNHALTVGARAGDLAALYNGNIYSIIVLGRIATTQEITDTETWVNGKTGAY